MCIVEDFISAIRVGEHMPTLCLFGTSIQPLHLQWVLGCSSVVLWLDNDPPGVKASSEISKRICQEVLKHQKERAFLGVGAFAVREQRTERQPKELSPNEIKQILS